MMTEPLLPSNPPDSDGNSFRREILRQMDFDGGSDHAEAMAEPVLPSNDNSPTEAPNADAGDHHVEFVPGIGHRCLSDCESRAPHSLNPAAGCCCDSGYLAWRDGRECPIHGLAGRSNDVQGSAKLSGNPGSNDEPTDDREYEVIGATRSPEEVLEYWVEKWDAAHVELIETRADRDDWRNAAQAAKGHYEQSDARLEAVTTERDEYSETVAMQWGQLKSARASAETARAESQRLRTACEQIRTLAEAAKASLPHATYTGVSWHRVLEILDAPDAVLGGLAAGYGKQCEA